MTEENTQDMNEDTESTNPIEEVGLNIQDLKVMLQMIQVVSQRGAVRPDEMQVVGALYNKLFQFLKAAGALEPAQQAAAEGEEAPAEGDEAESDTTDAE